MMYCKKCGAEISNESAFCKNCGEPTGRTIPQTNQAASSGNKGSRKVGLVVGIIMAIAVFAALIAIFAPRTARQGPAGWDTPEEAAHYAMEGLVELDGDKIIGSIPPEILGQLSKSQMESLEKQIWIGFQGIEISKEIRGGGGDCETHFEVVSMKDYSAEDQAELQTMYQNDYAVMVQEAAKAKVSYTATFSNGRDKDGMETVPLVKINNKWYLDIIFKD